MESFLYDSLKGPNDLFKMSSISPKAIATITNKYGYRTLKVITTVIVLKIPKVANTVIPGIIRSMTDISFENLVKILPIGLLSKNRILDLMTFSTITLCILDVLIINMVKITTALMKTKMQ